MSQFSKPDDPTRAPDVERPVDDQSTPDGRHQLTVPTRPAGAKLAWLRGRDRRANSASNDPAVPLAPATDSPTETSAISVARDRRTEDSDEDVERLLRTADRLNEDGAVGPAVRLYRKILMLKPDHEQAASLRLFVHVHERLISDADQAEVTAEQTETCGLDDGQTSRAVLRRQQAFRNVKLATLTAVSIIAGSYWVFYTGSFVVLVIGSFLDSANNLLRERTHDDLFGNGYAACERAVRQQIATPATATFPGRFARDTITEGPTTGQGSQLIQTWWIRSYFDAENRFGAHERWRV